MHPAHIRNPTLKPDRIVQADLGINPCMYGCDCMDEQLVLLISDHEVADSNLAGGKILPKPKLCFISLSLFDLI